jgi:hypothetical protein
MLQSAIREIWEAKSGKDGMEDQTQEPTAATMMSQSSHHSPLVTMYLEMHRNTVKSEVKAMEETAQATMRYCLDSFGYPTQRSSRTRAESARQVGISLCQGFDHES